MTPNRLAVRWVVLWVSVSVCLWLRVHVRVWVSVVCGCVWLRARVCVRVRARVCVRAACIPACVRVRACICPYARASLCVRACFGVRMCARANLLMLPPTTASWRYSVATGPGKSWILKSVLESPWKSWNFPNFKENPGIVLEFFYKNHADVSSHICFHLLTDLYYHNSMSCVWLKPVDNQWKYFKYFNIFYIFTSNRPVWIARKITTLYFIKCFCLGLFELLDSQFTSCLFYKMLLCNVENMKVWRAINVVFRQHPCLPFSKFGWTSWDRVNISFSFKLKIRKYVKGF